MYLKLLIGALVLSLAVTVSAGDKTASDPVQPNPSDETQAPQEFPWYIDYCPQSANCYSTEEGYCWEFPDGTVFLFLANGDLIIETPCGIRIIFKPDGRIIIELPDLNESNESSHGENGDHFRCPDGSLIELNLSGNIDFVMPDGSGVTFDPSGIFNDFDSRDEPAEEEDEPVEVEQDEFSLISATD